MHKKTVKFSIMMITAALAVTLVSLWLVAIYREHDARALLLPNGAISVFPDPRPLTSFALTDHHNQVFDQARLQGKWTFLFFGYTHCADICPTTLAVLARVRENISRDKVGADNVQFVFVSVDPHRDSAPSLGQYVGYFDASFLGVTGDEAQIANLAAQLGAAYRVEFVPGVEDYPVSHTPAVFLLDPLARYHAVFTSTQDAEAIGARFKLVRELESEQAP